VVAEFKIMSPSSYANVPVAHGHQLRMTQHATGVRKRGINGYESLLADLNAKTA
jgi:hypothetical protein